MPIKHDYQANIIRYQLWHFFAIFHRLMLVFWADAIAAVWRIAAASYRCITVTQWMPRDTERVLKIGASRQPYPWAIAPLHPR